MNWDFLTANVYNVTDKGDYMTYYLKIDGLQEGFAINGVKVIVFKHSGMYKVYKPSSKVAYSTKPISHFDWIKDSDLGIAIEEACLKAVDTTENLENFSS